MTKLDDWMTALRDMYRKEWLHENPGSWMSDEQMSRILIKALKADGKKISQDADGVWHMADCDRYGRK